MRLNIPRWSANFESECKSRRPKKGMRFVPLPVDFGGPANIALSRMGDQGAAFLGIYERMIQISGKLPEGRRGDIAQQDGRPYTLAMLSLVTGFSQELIADAIQFFSLPEVGWLIDLDAPNTSHLSRVAIMPERMLVAAVDEATDEMSELQAEIERVAQVISNLWVTHCGIPQRILGPVQVKEALKDIAPNVKMVKHFEDKAEEYIRNANGPKFFQRLSGWLRSPEARAPLLAQVKQTEAAQIAPESAEESARRRQEMRQMAAEAIASGTMTAIQVKERWNVDI